MDNTIVDCFFDSQCKFALRPQDVWKYDRHPVSDGRD